MLSLKHVEPRICPVTDHECGNESCYENSNCIADDDGVTTTIEDEVSAVERQFAPARQDVAIVEEIRALSPVDQVMGMIAAASRDPAVDVSKMRELFSLQKDLMTMQAERQFNEAFDRLELPRIKKNGAVEYKGKEAFKFATWENIDAAIRPLLKAEGFSLSFDSVPRQGEGGGLIVTGTLSHIGGHKRTSSIPVPLDTSGGKNNIQGYGSAMSYGKRYTTTSLLNIVTEGEDDDGRKAGWKHLTGDQVGELADLLKEAGQTEPRFLMRMASSADGKPVKKLEELGAHDFERIANTLKLMIDRKGKPDAPGNT